MSWEELLLEEHVRTEAGVHHFSTALPAPPRPLSGRWPLLTVGSGPANAHTAQAACPPSPLPSALCPPHTSQHSALRPHWQHHAEGRLGVSGASEQAGGMHGPSRVPAAAPQHAVRYLGFFLRSRENSLAFFLWGRRDGGLHRGKCGMRGWPVLTPHQSH